ncbi:MAG: chromate transporter [Bacteriovoracaceae bacterium]|nr:chromate transporter [Bacteriovoracaceae bacterium]
MTKLVEILKLFFHLGLVAFGGPAAHIAMIHKEVVDKRKWMDEKHFLDLVGATSLIPGPNSTEMVIHCGYHRGGVAGLFISGISFILPACALTFILAYLYTLAYNIPNFEAYMIGIKPVVIILIFQALQKLWKKAITGYELALISAAVLALGFTGIGEVYALFIGAILGFMMLKLKNKFTVTSVALPSIFWVFTKIGSVLFGSGYVLIAYLQDEIVHKRAWLTSAQIADAVAIGQFTPGPVLSTSTFVGYLLGGGWGSVLASVGIFLPSFLFVLLLNPLIPKMRNSKNFSLLLDCVNAGAIGLMAYALFPLGKVAFLNPIGILIFILTILLLWKFPKISSLKLVSFGIVSGVVFVKAFELLEINKFIS